MQLVELSGKFSADSNPIQSEDSSGERQKEEEKENRGYAARNSVLDETD